MTDKEKILDLQRTISYYKKLAWAESMIINVMAVEFKLPEDKVMDIVNSCKMRTGIRDDD